MFAASDGFRVGYGLLEEIEIEGGLALKQMHNDRHFSLGCRRHPHLPCRRPFAGSSPLPTTITIRPMPNPSCSPLPAHSAPPLVKFPCASVSCLTCSTFAVWAATSTRTAASTRKSARNLKQRVQQCNGPQSSGAAGTSPLAPKRAYMAAWWFRSCCMESWPITPFQLQRLEVFHRQCLRSILGVTPRTVRASAMASA
jgi:hypothetical protein